MTPFQMFKYLDKNLASPRILTRHLSWNYMHVPTIVYRYTDSFLLSTKQTCSIQFRKSRLRDHQGQHTWKASFRIKNFISISLSKCRSWGYVKVSGTTFSPARSRNSTKSSSDKGAHKRTMYTYKDVTDILVFAHKNKTAFGAYWRYSMLVQRTKYVPTH